jgi:uncharacterized protein YndB with AHSA1/START domain
MPVKKEEDGRRFVEAEVEVPGSPEDVWRAIATGKGISSWFVPSKVEEREGGTTVTSFGPGMDAVAKITHWNPPKSFTAEAADESLSVATEWTVEARAGGTCVVRVVHRPWATRPCCRSGSTSSATTPIRSRQSLNGRGAIGSPNDSLGR